MQKECVFCYLLNELANVADDMLFSVSFNWTKWFIKNNYFYSKELVVEVIVAACSYLGIHSAPKVQIVQMQG